MKQLALAILLAFYTTTLATPPKAPDAPVERFSDDVCLVWVIWDESRGESLRGSRAVYDVVKRRMKLRKKTACEVVSEAGQFSGYKKGMKFRADEEMWARYERVRKMRPVAPNADHFHASYVSPSWAAKMKKVVTIGLHTFYQKVHQKVRPNQHKGEINDTSNLYEVEER